MKTTLAIVSFALAGCASVATSSTLGTKPTYLDVFTTAVHNAAALSHHIYTPSLDDGYVPQGLASGEGYLYVSSYLPRPDLKANTGPCRIFRIEAATGKPAGTIDIPEGTCTHSGGMAYLGNGRLFLADTRQVFMIDVPKALASGTSAGASKAVKIAGLLRGSYAASDGKDFWIGTWTKDKPEVAKMFRLDPKLFDDYDGKTVQEERAVESIPVPLEAQGAAFAKDGTLWVSASNSKWGKLYQLSRTGQVLKEYAMTPGLEDLTVDESGQLWGLSESGTRKYIDWETKFPYIFKIDTGALK